MSAIFSFFLIAFSFYLAGSTMIALLNQKVFKANALTVHPVVMSLPILYLFFLISLNVKTSLIVLLVAALASLFVFFKKLDWRNVGKFFITAYVLYFVICQHPLLGWDTRSIWFFHSKIFYFFNGNEILSHLNRDEIALFSHSDYPKMHPFLGALFAIPFAEWKEQIAKASLALLWIPVFFEIFRLTNLKIKALALFCIFVLSGGQIIAGMTDWLLACYALIAFLLYHESEERWLDSIAYLSLPILIKAEGLVISGLGIFIILTLKSGIAWRVLLKNSLRASVIVVVPGLAFLLWKVHCAKYGIHNYLTTDPTATMNKLTGRLTDGGKSLEIFVNAFGYYNKIIKNMMYVALIRRLFIWQKITRFEVAVFAFAAVYTTFLFFTYMATPFDLDWHLSTSVERTAFPIFLLALMTLLIRDIDPVKKL